MDVFTGALIAGRPTLRAAAIAAAHELGLFDEVPEHPSRKLRALLDVLVFEGILTRDHRPLTIPPRPPIAAREGWWRLAEVIRTGRPLPEPDLEGRRRFHDHLFSAGLDAARETIAHLDAGPLVDLGGGAGAYVQGALEAHPERRATLVDRPEIVGFARRRLAGFGDRVTFVEGELPDVDLPPDHAVALLANVLHLHGPATGKALISAASRALRPGGVVAVKDLHVEPDRSGPAAGLYFALNMALYTPDGDVYDAETISSWMRDAGLEDVRTQRLERTGEGMLVLGRKAASPRKG